MAKNKMYSVAFINLKTKKRGIDYIKAASKVEVKKKYPKTKFKVTWITEKKYK